MEEATTNLITTSQEAVQQAIPKVTHKKKHFKYSSGHSSIS